MRDRRKRRVLAPSDDDDDSDLSEGSENYYNSSSGYISANAANAARSRDYGRARRGRDEMEYFSDDDQDLIETAGSEIEAASEEEDDDDLDEGSEMLESSQPLEPPKDISGLFKLF